VTELTKLATQFLPAQVSHAVANGFNPTVYAAEALGLALAGGNGTSNAFATDFGSLSVSQFASEVASLTGINSGAIGGFVQNWINFYTANPSATFGLSATLASYGAAFGDAVGAALLNPTVNGTLALLVSEEQNALIDNAEGLYKAGISLIAELPHLPLQGGAFLIPDAGGAPFGEIIDWASLVGAGNYAQFIAPTQTGDLIIKNAPSTFTLNTQHYGNSNDNVQINPAVGSGDLFTLILGDSTSGGGLGKVFAGGYSTVEIVTVGSFDGGVILMPKGIEITGNLVISGGAILELGDISPFSVIAQTITDNGVGLLLGTPHAEKIDASNGGFLFMAAPADSQGFVLPTTGLTVLGGSGGFNNLQGSLGPTLGTVTFSNSSTGVVAGTYVGADNITGGSGGSDTIYGDGGPDTITLPPNHSLPDTVVFGEDLMGEPGALAKHDVLAITGGSDQAYLGSWGAGTTPTAIPNLFPGNTGGTSADMTVITGFLAGRPGGDVLDFTTAAWNGESAFSTKGDLVVLNGVSGVPLGAAQLSAVWFNSGSNNSLKTTDNVLVYAPSDASVQNAQQLAAQLHTASDAVMLPQGGLIGPGEDKHILVAYDASFNLLGTIHPVVNIADVDLVNTSASNQNSTANLNVYASDMVSLTGVSLTSLTSDNIHFI
jgi:hypothetical protein